MASLKQIEANRNNAQRSTGPKSDDGKARARFNALRHGLRADSVDVLPNEDPVAYQARLDLWLDEYQPANATEDQLVRHAANLSWKIERADRYETALLSKRVEEAMTQAERATRDRLDIAWRKLLPQAQEVEKAGLAREEASRLLADVEASAEGCRCLITAWRNLRKSAASSKPWSYEQELHAIRLLGHGPHTIKDPAVVEMVVANRTALYPSHDPTYEKWFHGTLQTYFDMPVVQGACDRKPSTLEQAYERLVAVADKTIARLEQLLVQREQEGDQTTHKALAAGAIASFDPGVEGERIRRYQFSLSRELSRTIDTLRKIRREESRRDHALVTFEAGPETEPRLADAIVETQAADTVSSPGSDAPNEPNSQVNVQFLFGPEPVRAEQLTKRPAPNEPNLRRPMTQREKALAKMIKRSQSKR